MMRCLEGLRTLMLQVLRLGTRTKGKRASYSQHRAQLPTDKRPVVNRLVLAARSGTPRVLLMARASPDSDPGQHRGTSANYPRNIEAEAALLGAILIDNRVVGRSAGGSSSRCISSNRVHGRIFEQTILKLLERNMHRERR
jgi:hypothetical protein